MQSTETNMGFLWEQQVVFNNFRVGYSVFRMLVIYHTLFVPSLLVLYQAEDVRNKTWPRRIFILEGGWKQIWSLEIYLTKESPRLNTKLKGNQVCSPLKRTIMLPISFPHQASSQISIFLMCSSQQLLLIHIHMWIPMTGSGVVPVLNSKELNSDILYVLSHTLSDFERFNPTTTTLI